MKGKKKPFNGPNSKGLSQGGEAEINWTSRTAFLKEEHMLRNHLDGWLEMPSSGPNVQLFKSESLGVGPRQLHFRHLPRSRDAADTENLYPNNCAHVRWTFFMWPFPHLDGSLTWIDPSPRRPKTRLWAFISLILFHELRLCQSFQKSYFKGHKENQAKGYYDSLAQIHLYCRKDLARTPCPDHRQ